MADNRDSISTHSTEPDPDPEKQAQLDAEEEQAREEEARQASENIRNASASEKELLSKAGSSAQERRGKGS